MKRTASTAATAAASLCVLVCTTSTLVSSFIPTAVNVDPLARHHQSIVGHRNRPLTWSTGPHQLSSGKGFGSDNTDNTVSTASQSSVPSRTSSNVGKGSGEFELQEMKFQLSGMKKAGVSARNLNQEKKSEIAQYVREVVLRIPSPIPLKALADKDRLVGKWRLTFSTDAAAMGDLPREASVLIDIQEGNKLDYQLEFSKKVWGLKGITAKSSYVVDASPVNPGLVTYIYQEISAGVFGLTVPTGLFGMLKGREAYIESVWFDGNYWIDRGYSQEGEEYYNVYTREVGSEDEIDKSRY